jgi:hypothetical protein
MFLCLAEAQAIHEHFLAKRLLEQVVESAETLSGKLKENRE